MRTSAYQTIFIFSLHLSFLNMGLGQPTGLLMDDSRYDALPSGNLEKVKDHFVPASFSLKSFTPFPASQGKMASCVGWASGYGALTIERAVSNGITDRVFITDRMAHSAMYLYKHIKRGADCQSPASINDALEFLQKEGDCLESTYPTSTYDCETPVPSDDLLKEARKYRISSTGYRLFASGSDGVVKIKSVKAHLAAGHPVIVGMSVSPAYRNLVGKERWQVESNNSGGHAMIVVSYSDHKQTFELMNSYGTSWGRGGFIDISYEDFASFCQQAFVLYNDLGTKGMERGQQKHVTILSTSIEVSTWQENDSSYKTLEFEYLNSVYDAKMPLQKFQPTKLSIAVEKGRCAYLLNMDKHGLIRLIWSIEYPDRDTLIWVPNDGWWEFDQSGQEFFCLLYGYEFIPDLKNEIKRINLYPGADFYAQILKGTQLTTCLIDQVDYISRSIAAVANLTSGEASYLPVFFNLNIIP